MQASSLSTQVLLKMLRCRRTSSSSSSRSTGEGLADSFIGWLLLSGSEVKIAEDNRALVEHGVLSSNAHRSYQGRYRNTGHSTKDVPTPSVCSRSLTEKASTISLASYFLNLLCAGGNGT